MTVVDGAFEENAPPTGRNQVSGKTGFGAAPPNV
jgi:hypothetical protein